MNYIYENIKLHNLYEASLICLFLLSICWVVNSARSGSGKVVGWVAKYIAPYLHTENETFKLNQSFQRKMAAPKWKEQYVFIQILNWGRILFSNNIEENITEC